jgi:hypothetical protein
MLLWPFCIRSDFGWSQNCYYCAFEIAAGDRRKKEQTRFLLLKNQNRELLRKMRTNGQKKQELKLDKDKR